MCLFKLHCCGVNNTKDYYNIHHAVPKSCCKGHDCKVVENIYEVGCQVKFEEYLADKMLTFTIVSWLLVLIEVSWS